MRQHLQPRLGLIIAGILLITYCYLLMNYFGFYSNQKTITIKEFINNCETTTLDENEEVAIFGNIENEKENADMDDLNTELKIAPAWKKIVDLDNSNTELKIAPPSPTPDTYEHLINWGFPMSGSLKSPKPAFVLGNVSGKADFIIGIPTVKREKADYLMGTLRSLVKNRKVTKEIFKIIVFIADVDQAYLNQRSQQIFNAFKQEFESGRMQVISPPKHYYPDWSTAITTTLNDPIDRVKWRSKENLDTVFLMMYIYQLSPKYYLMLEDDVLSDEGYDRTIVDNTKRLKHSDWFFISYCGWCSIGKLFKAETIPSFASFVHMFWNKKPLDWLQRDYTKTAYCNNDGTEEDCKREFSKRVPAIQPYVFHHVGKYSSLKGKQQPVYG